MTDKRFQANYQGDCLVSITDKQNHENIDIVQMVDLLNEFNDENEQLQKQLLDVKKENYGNLDGLNYYQEQNGHLSSKISDLECENEQSKQQLRIFRDGLKREIRETKEVFEDYSECVDEKLELKKENEQLKERIMELQEKNKELIELVNEVDNELEIRDIVCGAGKFRLEEWGKHRYHQFYKGDEELEDESVVIMLMELEKENKELKYHLNETEKELKEYKDFMSLG